MDISNLLASSEEPLYLLGSVSAEASIKLKLCKVSPRKKQLFLGKKNQANVRQAQQHTAQAKYRHGLAAPVCVVQIPEVSPALLTSCSDERLLCRVLPLWSSFPQPLARNLLARSPLGRVWEKHFPLPVGKDVIKAL